MQTPEAFRSKLPDVGTTIFTVMSRLAREHNAINLSQGFPNWDCDERLKDLVIKYMRDGHNQYSPMPGVPALRESIAEKVNHMYGVSIDPDKHITITTGATQAIYTAIGAVISAGDNAIIFDPAYDSYAPAVKSYGGSIKPIALAAPEFNINWKEVESLIDEKTRLIVVNTPHNPLGKLLTEEDMLKLAEIASEHNLYVLSDEVYEHLVYDGREHCSAVRYPELWERCFAVYSFGKTLHATGWKSGYCLAPEDLTIEFRKVHQFVTFAVNTPIQLGVADYIRDPETYKGLNQFFQDKRDFFLEHMKDSPFKMLPSEGSYFVLGDYSSISDKSDIEFSEWLIREHGVATIPLSPFYASPPNQKLVRFCFAKTEDVLQEAAARLAKI